MRLEMQRVTGLSNWFAGENLRLARNSCREFMTRHTAEITEAEQRAWLDSLPLRRGEVQPYTFSTLVPMENSVWKEKPVLPRPVGFGVIRTEAGKDWLTGGLLPEWRGKGLGRRLFWLLMSQCESPEIWLEVQADNDRAFNLYTQLGFETCAWDPERAVWTLRWEGAP